MMPNFHLKVLPPLQLQLWNDFQPQSDFLNSQGFYLAGGTALALQMGHRQSLDFDFFSQKSDVADPLSERLQQFPNFLLRETDADTIHAEIAGVKVSFIGHYKYPLVAECATLGTIRLAGILDIGLMKLLAITHRATFRDYLDLAIILRDKIPLPELLQASTKKYGGHFNVMICLKALVSFQDVDQEEPKILDLKLKSSWQDILTQAVKQVA